MTSIAVIQKGLANYLDTELMPLIPTAEKGKKFATGVILSLAIKKLDSLVASLGNKYMLNDIGIITPEGVDIDTLRDVVIANIPAEGLTLSIPMLGEMTLHAEDIKKLYNCIKNAEEVS